MIYIDTGAFLGRYLVRDQHHDQACAGWRLLAERRERCATSNFVLDETFTLLGRRASYEFAAERSRNLLKSTTLQILRPEADDELAAVAFFEKFADQKVSFTDCISFALMQKSGLKEVFSFDQHFERAGFVLWPSDRK